MIAIDTSVAVAGFAPWHENHVVAITSMRGHPWLPAQCGLETYATLTRLPEPFRAPPPVVAEYIARRFGTRWLEPLVDDLRSLPGELAAAGIVGGSCYDGIVALTARHHGATLRTLDRRAEATYRAIGARYELIAT